MATYTFQNYSKVTFQDDSVLWDKNHSFVIHEPVTRFLPRTNACENNAKSRGLFLHVSINR